MDASFADLWGVTYEELSERCVRGSRRFNCQLLQHASVMRTMRRACSFSSCLNELLRLLLAGSMARCWSGFNDWWTCCDKRTRRSVCFSRSWRRRTRCHYTSSQPRPRSPHSKPGCWLSLSAQAAAHHLSPEHSTSLTLRPGRSRSSSNAASLRVSRVPLAESHGCVRGDGDSVAGGAAASRR